MDSTPFYEHYKKILGNDSEVWVHVSPSSVGIKVEGGGKIAGVRYPKPITSATYNRAFKQLDAALSDQ